eukprot:TRINITY_DN25548_c1_g1_i2.p6 TRINITY_DN25548_c1_g1~~TRINITY_DN25548_c1_g1_i2.p6  ORF type:complete len:105 (-),score=5.12 TRINITY_DN25548_c1_g1_i2:556-870(-)
MDLLLYFYSYSISIKIYCFYAYCVRDLFCVSFFSFFAWIEFHFFIIFSNSLSTLYAQNIKMFGNKKLLKVEAMSVGMWGFFLNIILCQKTGREQFFNDLLVVFF